MKKRVLSGMQASGRLHIGNWVGALRKWVSLQDDYDCYYFVADWHALTTGYADPSALRASTEDIVTNFLAAGLDPQRCTIFLQSKVLEHAELHLLLGMITPLGWLERVPTYKDKKDNLQERDLSMYGFLGYPVLQSADIMIYKANYVPVGIDQIPHLEITREIARRFNAMYNADILVEPDALLTEFPKVPGTDGRKMSKSYGNAIYLSDTQAELEVKVRQMMTDPARIKRTDKGDPELSPVYQLHKIFSSPQELAEIAEGCRTAGIGCIDCKKRLIKNIGEALGPLWQRRAELASNPSIVKEALALGTQKAAAAARETMLEVRHAMGLGIF